MTAPKKKKARVIRLELPAEMVELCEIADVDAADVLSGYMRDLLRLPDSHGSDERDKALVYFLRMIGHYTDKYYELEDHIRYQYRG